MGQSLLINDDLPPRRKTFALTVRRCPHCKGTHVLLDFAPLARPEPDKPGYTHWSLCRVTGKKILGRKD